MLLSKVKYKNASSTSGEIHLVILACVDLVNYGSFAGVGKAPVKFRVLIMEPYL